MKRFSASVFLSLASLLASCTSFSQQPHPDPKQSHLAQEATADHFWFWKNPDAIYVSKDVPSGEEDSIRDIPRLENAFSDTAPKDRQDGLVMGELGVDGGDKDKILKLVQEIADGQHKKVNSLLIAHKGKFVFESYFLSGRVNLTHPQASATKTYTSLALGRAIQLGYLTMADLDKPVISFLKELDPTQFVNGAERVTLHQALTMRTGIRLNDEKAEALRKHRDQMIGQSLVQNLLEQSDPVTAQSQRDFAYGHYSSPLVMQVIDAVVPGTAEAFIKRELFGKMGITTYGWSTGMGGLPSAGSRASVTSRDMLKLGTLAINKGQWNGEQLIPQAYIARATQPILYPGDDSIFGGGKDVSNQGYGYFWWSGDLKSGDKRYFSTSAQGGGGQFIILIDELDLIVVSTGHERHPVTLQMVAEHVLPAFIQEQ
ncbi:MAG: serine hydrolase domain-containing protein [Lysobacterales bacterium]